MTRFQSSSAVVSLCVLRLLPHSRRIGAAAAGAGRRARAGRHRTFQISALLVPVFDDAARGVAEFAAQCERIAGAPLRPRDRQPGDGVEHDQPRHRPHHDAPVSPPACCSPSVEIPVPLTTIEYAELFGHEFEHILEQIDRVDLEALTAARAGATRLADGAYETTRARKAGQTIADETTPATRGGGAARAATDTGRTRPDRRAPPGRGGQPRGRAIRQDCRPGAAVPVL